MGRKEQVREREALAQFGMKRCSKCRGVKPRVNFGRDKKRWDGLVPQCKECRARYMRETKPARQEYIRQYHRDNRERLNDKSRQYYQENRESRLQYARKYAKDTDANRRYYWQNREARLEKKRQWNRDNKEAIREYDRQYRQTPEGKAVGRKAYRKRRALKAAVNENFTAEDEAFVFERDGHKCVECGITNQEHLAQFGQRLHIDHVLPLSKGHALTRENAALRCRSCNSRKKDR